MRTGKWPDRTMFVLELRASSDQGSILESGRFQKEVVGIEASVKDERRFPEKWAYFGFEGGSNEAAPFPKSAGCLSCHQQQRGRRQHVRAVLSDVAGSRDADGHNRALIQRARRNMRPAAANAIASPAQRMNTIRTPKASASTPDSTRPMI